MKKSFRLLLTMLLLLVGYVSAYAQGPVTVFIYPSNKGATVCPGTEVTYNINSDHYAVFQTRVLITNGIITSFTGAPGSARVSASEVRLLNPVDADGLPLDVTVTVKWSNPSIGKLNTTVYYRWGGFGFTQRQSGEFTQQIGINAPMSAGFDSRLCAGNSGTFSIQSVREATSYTWTAPDANWQINGQSSYTGTSTSVVVTASANVAAGTYYIPVRSNGNLPCGGTGYVPVIVSNVPPTIAPSFGLEPQPDGSYRLRVANMAYATNFVYSLHGGLSYNTVYVDHNDPFGFTTLASGLLGPTTYNVAIAAENGCGRAAFTYSTVSIPGPGGGGVEEPYRTAPTVYPNPCSDLLTVQVGQTQKGTLVLLNSQGEQVREEKLQGTQVTLDVRSLPDGLYRLVMPAADKKGTVSHSLQIQH
ncbi:T9SS type A sorting domain-containing protein [Hymenobacter sediminis]|uniref:T9SS type A sorting domain-containing protein n=1 Tax=Hymenobacter sediminis TaxID=2218621 RepID=UPI00138FA503|nr:T9SS type A sorting domain-containing protein [Hymenobacter sediminis]